MEPGTIIAGKFRVERVIGKGGMGTVVVATHLQLEQRVALKFLNPELANQPAIAQRFLREARSSARLRSEYVCRVIDVAELDTGAPYIVMECLEGEDLGRLVARSPLGIATAADFVVQACVAIAEAHAAGIVHRDLKPSNLFLTQRLDGAALVKVLDFGIATAPGSDNRITQTSSLMGSPAYMSPEQLRSAKDVDARSDVWSLGVILYELVSGRLPFPGDSITEVAVKVSVDPAVPLGISREFDAVVMRAIEKDLARRYQSVSELANALVPFGGGQTRALAAVIGKLLGGSKSAIEEVSRPAPPPDPRGFMATQPSGEQETKATQETTLGGAASSHELPKAAPKQPSRRRGLYVGFGVLGALAVGGGVFAVVHGGGEAPPAAKSPVIAATPPVDAAPPPPPADADDTLANERAEVVELATRHEWAAMLDVGPGSDDALVGDRIADAQKRVTENRVLMTQALSKHDCARANAIAATGGDPELTKLAHGCGAATKPPVIASGGSGSAATSPEPKVTKAEIRGINDEARARLAAGNYAEAIAKAKLVTKDHPGNGLAWAITIAGECGLGHVAEANEAYAHFAKTLHAQILIDYSKICAAHHIELAGEPADTAPRKRHPAD